MMTPYKGAPRPAPRRARTLARCGLCRHALVAALMGLMGLMAPMAPAQAQTLQWYRVPASASGTDDTVAPSAPTAPLAPPDPARAARAGDTPRGTLGSRAPGAAPATSAPLLYGELVSDVARRHALDPLLVHAVVATESGYRPAVVSNKGAVGLMQVTPATGARFGKTALDEPRENLEAGSAYLSWLVQHFGGRLELALAGYNAGEGAVMRYGNAVPPYAETQAYVRKVLSHYASLRGEGAADAMLPAAWRSGAPAQPVSAAVPTPPTPAGRVSRPAPAAVPSAVPATARHAAAGAGDMGQWWQLLIGGSARAEAHPKLRP